MKKLRIKLQCRVSKVVLGDVLLLSPKSQSKPFMKRLSVSAFFASIALALTAHAGSSVYQLVIDVADPAAVTFTATGENATANQSSPIDFSGGITLENFFPLSESISATGLAVTGTLAPHGTATTYDSLVTFNYDANTGDVEAGDDLSVYNAEASGSDMQNFITSASAFSGSSVVDFTGYTLPTAGTFGFIDNGYKASQGGAIGTWTVINSSAIPEPSTCALLAGLTVLGCVAMRRRNRR